MSRDYIKQIAEAVQKAVIDSGRHDNSTFPVPTTFTTQQLEAIIESVPKPEPVGTIHEAFPTPLYGMTGYEFASKYRLCIGTELFTVPVDQSARIAELERQIKGYQKECFDVEQTLGRALKYPRYADDLRSFPDATDADGVCIGEHAPGSLAVEAANKIAELEAKLAVVEKNAARYSKLWEMKNFTPSKTLTHALFSFKCWCSKEEGDAAIDAAMEAKK